MCVCVCLTLGTGRSRSDCSDCVSPGSCTLYTVLAVTLPLSATVSRGTICCSADTQTATIRYGNVISKHNLYLYSPLEDVKPIAKNLLGHVPLIVFLFYFYSIQFILYIIYLKCQFTICHAKAWLTLFTD